MKSQRKLKNYLIEPKTQLQFGFLAIGASIVYLVAMSWIVYQALHSLFQFVLEMTDFPDEIRRILSAEIQTKSFYAMGISVLYALFTLSMMVYFSHRLVGPKVAFLRHVEALKNGNYKSRIHLRQSDNFKDLAISLNDLAQNLENESSSKKVG